MSNPSNRVREALLRRPLFFLAIIFSLLIGGTQNFRESFLPKDSIAHKNNLSEASIYLGGIVDSSVVSKPDRYGQTHVSFVLRTRRFWEGKGTEGEIVSGKTKVYLTDPPSCPDYGDEIVLQGRLSAPKGLRNPGGFNQAAFLKIQGIRSVFYAEKRAPLKILRKGAGNPFAAAAIQSRNFLSLKISDGLGEGATGDFLKALLLGEREGFDEELKNIFMKTGTIHLLAVSGFNVGFLIASVLFFLSPFPLSKNWKWVFSLAAVWFYCLLVGWQAPMLRAAVMASLFIVGKLLGRRTDILNTLGLAALVILAIVPDQLYDIGFQLSFLAVFAIAVFLPAILEKPKLLPNETISWKEKVAEYFSELFWVSFVCQAAVLPVTIQNFYIVTPYSMLANLVAVPASFALFFLGILFLICFSWAPKFLFFIPMSIRFLMSLMTACLVFLERLPGSAITIGKLAPILWIILVAGIFYFFQTPRIEHKKIRALLIVLFLTNIFLAQEITRFWAHPGRVEMTALDVGQGDSIYIEFPDGSNCLVDAGKGGEGDRGRMVVAPFLKSKGVRTIDALVISHPQEDHIGGMPDLVDEFKIKALVEAGSAYSSQLFQQLKTKIAKEHSERLIASSGDRLLGFPDTEIFVLNPPLQQHSSKNINEDSLVLKMNYKNFSFLTTGDIEEKAMENMLSRGTDLKAQVLKVPHHGAKLKKSGTLFVQSVHPEVSIISVGERNPFHHPREETLNVLKSIPGNTVYRTDQEGAVTVSADGNLFVVRTAVAQVS